MKTIKIYASGSQIIFKANKQSWVLAVNSCEREDTCESLVKRIQSLGFDFDRKSSIRDVLDSYDQPIKITKYDIPSLVI